MDRCKEVISFHENQLPLFSEIYAFARANKDNFEFITDEEGKQAVKELETIYDDPRPDQTLPKYRKRRDILRAKLTEIKAELVAVFFAFDFTFFAPASLMFSFCAFPTALTSFR